MKLITEKEQIVTNLKREQVQYTIASSPKAFSVLMDKLYSDKIGSIVRELTSNAYDAHVEARRGNLPFEVTCPTALAPTFSVRDYGNSMDHDFVMKLYSSVFYSSKEDTNEQVGTFGLGSKSPFAYADGFNLACFRDGKVNLYSAFYDEDRVPSITHIAEKDTKEPDGTYVSFQVSAKDVKAFEQAITFVYGCYWRTPFRVVNIEPPQTIKPSLLLDDVNWVHMVPVNGGNTWNRKRWFSQGNVWYPVPERFLGNYYQGRATDAAATDEKIDWSPYIDLVIEVPIGTFNITPSREAISLDKYSIEKINSFLKYTREALKAKVAELYSTCKTRLDYYNVYHDLHRSAASGLAAFPIPSPLDINANSSHINIATDHELNPMTASWGEQKLADTTPNRLYHMPKSNMFGPVSSISDPTVVKLYVGLEREMVRKVMRCRTVSTTNTYYCYTEALPRFVRILGLQPHQIFSLDQIPDPGPNGNVKSNTPIVQPVTTAPDVFIVVTQNLSISAKDPFVSMVQQDEYSKATIDRDWVQGFLRNLASSYSVYDEKIYEQIRQLRLQTIHLEKYAGDNTRHLWPVLLDIVGGEDELVEHMKHGDLFHSQKNALNWGLNTAPASHPLAGLYGFVSNEKIGKKYRVNQELAMAWRRWPFKELNDRLIKEVEETKEAFMKDMENTLVEYPLFTAKTPDELRKLLETYKCKTSNT